MIPTEYKQLLMFGDSITQQSMNPDGGTGAALGNLYQRKLDVINRGYSGYNTEWAIRVAPYLNLSLSSIELLTIWFGANDACTPIRTQSVERQRFKSNLKHIASLVGPTTNILFITPPPFGEHMRRKDVDLRFPGQHLELDRTIERTRDFAKAVGEVVDELGTTMGQRVALVEVHDAIETAAIKAGQGDREVGLETYLSDGLHLSGHGYKVVTQQIMDTIETKFPHLVPDRLQRRFPDWTMVDPSKPDEAFQACEGKPE